MSNKLFKQTIDSAIEIFQPKQTTEEVIQEIHNSFEDAADRLLSEAQGIISNTAIDEVALMKKRLGFGKAIGVKETEDNMSEISNSERIKKNILYFQQNYPGYKVITEQEVKKICDKYKLVFGDTSDYLGDVPIKNLQEIEKFNSQREQIKPEDLRYLDNFDYRLYLYDIDRERTEISYKEALSNIYSRYPGQALAEGIAKQQVSAYTDMKICAPIKDMDMTNKKLVGHKIVADIPDPVVLFPLRNGFYIVVSKWGLESNDATLTNNKMN